MAGIAKLNGSSPNAVSIGGPFSAWLKAEADTRKPGSGVVVQWPGCTNKGVAQVIKQAF